MSKQAPPLGNLTPKEQTKLPTPKVKPMASSASLETGLNAVTDVPGSMTPGWTGDPNYIQNADFTAAKSNTPVGTEYVSSAPGVGNAIPPMDFSKVGGDAGKAIAEYKAPEDRMPAFLQMESRPNVPLDPTLPSRLAGDESTPFNFTGFSAGEVGTQQVQVQPGEMTPVYKSAADGFISDPTALPGMARVAINNGQPVEQYSYSQGPTASQINARNFFGELQQFRQQVAPREIPAFQYVPQQLSPAVTSGMSSENNGPLSWLIQSPNKDIDPLSGNFGASGGGLLGAAGWVLGRLSPLTYMQGAAMDVARAGASIWEGGNAFVNNLLQTGDVGKAFNVGATEASANYEANAPRARGMYTQTFGGSKDAGDFFTSSYFLSALSGAGDYSFSGVGQGILGGGGEAARNLTMKDENFNPFGMRNPFRTGFNTGGLEAQERAKGAWFGHGYDEWGRGGAGLVLDVLTGGLDDVARHSINKAFAKTAPLAPVGKALGKGTARYIPSPPATALPRIELPNIQVAVRGTASSGKKGEAYFRALSNKGTPGGPLVPVKPKDLGITQVIEGEIIDTGSDLVLRRNRTPVYNNRTPALRSSGEIVPYNFAQERFLPKGADPFSVSSTRAYTPAPGDIDFSKGGALVTTTKGEVTPAVLGVGGKPGGIPNKPRVSEGRKFIGGPAEPVTVWDEVTQSFKTTGKQGTSVERVLEAPGTIPQKVQPKPLPEPPRPLRGDVTPNALPGTVDDLAGNILTGANNVQKALPPVVPKETPNFTITPAKPEVPNTIVDELTGVFRDSEEMQALTNRYALPRVADDIPPVLQLPPSRIPAVGAEALAPSVAHADIVKQLTNPGALVVVNPRLAVRMERDVTSLAAMAETVQLPNGVRILSGGEVVDKFSLLQKHVDNAILASGLNPGSVEAQGIRRIFDRIGKEVPDGLQPGFSVEVAPRKLDQPAQYVTPQLQLTPAKDATVDVVAETVPDTVRPTLTKRQQAKLNKMRREGWSKAVNGEASPSQLGNTTETMWASSKAQDYYVGAKVDGKDVTLSRGEFTSLPISERVEVLRHSLKEGYALPKQAVDDALNPSVLTDNVAAKEYIRNNLPKEAQPLELNRKALETLAKHQETVADIDVVNKHITDISTQLYDIERNLDGFLQKVDELPDIGVDNLVDDVPLPAKMTPLDELPPKPVETPKVGDTFTFEDKGNILKPGAVPYRYIGEVDGNMRFAGLDDVTDFFILEASEFKQYQKMGVLKTKPGLASQLEETPGFVPNATTITPQGKKNVLKPKGAGFADNTGEVYTYIGTKGDKIAFIGEDKLGSPVLLELDELDNYIKKGVVNKSEAAPKTATPTPDNYSLTSYYHGTRVDGLHLQYLEPLDGASRSELGTGIWLTRSQDIASSAAGRGVPANVVPNPGRMFSDNAYIHELDDSALRNLNILPANEALPKNTIDALVGSFMDPHTIGDYMQYGDELSQDIVKLLSDKPSISAGELFDKVDDLTHEASKKLMGGRADEVELTFVQRTLTDILRGTGVDGLTNGINTVVYRTDTLRTKIVHDVTSAVGAASDDVVTSLHNVNLISRSLEASPGSKLLQVQLEEAKAVAASKIRDSLTDELAVMNAQKNKLVSDLLDVDDDLVKLTESQRYTKVMEAELRDEALLEKFTKELDSGKDWDSLCL